MKEYLEQVIEELKDQDNNDFIFLACFLMNLNTNTFKRKY